jgi:hypothetical protein
MTYEYKIINKETKEELKLYPIQYKTKAKAIEKAREDTRRAGANYYAVLFSFDWNRRPQYKNIGIVTGYETTKEAAQNSF